MCVELSDWNCYIYDVMVDGGRETDDSNSVVSVLISFMYDFLQFGVPRKPWISFLLFKGNNFSIRKSCKGNNFSIRKYCKSMYCECLFLQCNKDSILILNWKNTQHQINILSWSVSYIQGLSVKRTRFESVALRNPWFNCQCLFYYILLSVL